MRREHAEKCDGRSAVRRPAPYAEWTANGESQEPSKTTAALHTAAVCSKLRTTRIPRGSRWESAGIRDKTEKHYRRSNASAFASISKS